MLSKREFLRSQFLVAIGYMSMNLGNYVTSLLASRKLPDGTFATYVSLTSLAAVMTTVGGLAQPIIATHIASSDPLDERVFGAIAQRVATLCIAIAVAWTALSPVLLHLYRFDSWSILALLGCYVVVSTLLPALAGVVQGTSNYIGFAIAFLIGGISRPIVFLLFTRSGSSISRALAALVISLGVTVLIIVKAIPTANSIFRQLARPRLFKPNRMIVVSSVSLTSLAVLTYADVITARQRLDSAKAADFAAAALLTNITIYAAVVLITVLVPSVAGAGEAIERRAQIARWSVTLMFGVGIVYTLTLFIFGDGLARVTFGKEIAISNIALASYNATFVLIGIAGLSINFSVANASANRTCITSASAVLVYVVSLMVFGHSVNSIILCDLVGVTCLLLPTLLVRDSLLRVAVRRQSSAGRLR